MGRTHVAIRIVLLAVSKAQVETSPEEHDVVSAFSELCEVVDALGRFSWAAFSELREAVGATGRLPLAASDLVLKAASVRGQMARACWVDAWMASQASHRTSCDRLGHGAVEELALPVHGTPVEAEHLPLT